MTDHGPVWAQGSDTYVRVFLQPGASRTECRGRHGDAVRIRVAAPPVGGRANAACVRFVADRLNVADRQLSIVAGAGSRHKLLRIVGLDPGTVCRALGMIDE